MIFLCDRGVFNFIFYPLRVDDKKPQNDECSPRDNREKQAKDSEDDDEDASDNFQYIHKILNRKDEIASLFFLEKLNYL